MKEPAAGFHCRILGIDCLELQKYLEVIESWLKLIVD